MSNDTAKKPPLGLMPEWRHKELRLQEIRGAIERYLEAKEPIPVNWIAEEYALRGWLENREEELKDKIVYAKPSPSSYDGGRVDSRFIWDEPGQYITENPRERFNRNKTFVIPQSPTTNPPSAEAASREWEIVESCAEGGKPHPHNHPSFSHTCEEAGCKIYSVRRISDNQIFSIGDKVDFKSGGNVWGEFWSGKIISIKPAYTKEELEFEIYEEGEMESAVHKFISNIRHKKPTTPPASSKERIEQNSGVKYKSVIKFSKEVSDFIQTAWNLADDNWYWTEFFYRKVGDFSYELWSAHQLPASLKDFIKPKLFTQSDIDKAREDAFNAGRGTEGPKQTVNGVTTSVSIHQYPTFQDYLNSIPENLKEHWQE